eukprot:TRINITY_DN55371_c0_g1_i1.p1 TRINITY_DN55371_c0_g1~~TRINITY_DN55371_c0_g1_i1.p1  ORF type:complete len:139 (+),score=41.27 TRINITY_DN55371_c0_g1_i1:135-551(+)
MIRRPPRSTLSSSSAASDVYKRQLEYDVEQLLLGTLVFTVLLFLLPSLLSFYGFFTLVHLLLLLTQVVLGTVLLTFDTFPLLGIAYRIFSPSSLPDSVSFEVRRLAVLPHASKQSEFAPEAAKAVSYTHLTLPTKRIV